MLIAQIKQDLISYQKEGRPEAVSSLRMVLSSIINKEKDKRLKLSSEYSDSELELKSKLTEEEVIGVISGEAKKRKDAMFEFEKAGRLDLKEKEEKELKILQKYLPEELSEEEIEKIVKQVIEDRGIKDMKEIGTLMKEVIEKTKGRADGKKINNIARKLLS